MSADHGDDETTRPPPGLGDIRGRPIGFARVDTGQDAEDPATGRLSAREFRAALHEIASRPAQILPPTIIVSQRQKDAYEWVMERTLVLQRILAQTPRRRFVLRYMLRRMLGVKRLAILWPWAARKRSNLRWAWIEWKHRNDPEWQ